MHNVIVIIILVKCTYFGYMKLATQILGSLVPRLLVGGVQGYEIIWEWPEASIYKGTSIT